MKDEDEGLSVADLSYICDLVYKEAAIVLDDTKSYLIEARLEPLARREGFDSRRDLVECLRTAKNPGLIAKTVDAMTTNETSFFRDVHPFLALRKHVLPEIIERKAQQKRLNIWCAASSSGQEPYTIAMLLKEYFPELDSWTVSILATDISEEMLARCRKGMFSKLEVNRGLPAPLLVKYFEQEAAEWHVKEEVRSMIEFRFLNLIAPWPLIPKMDIVFIRNVLIYFDIKTKREILANIRKNMDLEGYMFLGGAETTLNIDAEFHRLRIGKSTCYTLTEKELAEIATSA